MNTCPDCGAHYMQNCSWWCGMSDEQIKEVNDRYTMTETVKNELREIERQLRVGIDSNVVANRVRKLLSKGN